MTFAPFSQGGRGAGWEVGENFKKPGARSQGRIGPIVALDECAAVGNHRQHRTDLRTRHSFEE